MSKARAIGSHVKLAFLGVNSARKLGPEDRQIAMLLFYAVEPGYGDPCFRGHFENGVESHRGKSSD